MLGGLQLASLQCLEESVVLYFSCLKQGLCRSHKEVVSVFIQRVVQGGNLEVGSQTCAANGLAVGCEE